ncbi:MAG: tripartite tricarboxylate transporter substrate binding protein [Candidatus Parcubacteria bacterium]|nr:tripartite tricarboxylate transporter substrate binding protein [Burkholderiales bacterium]
MPKKLIHRALAAVLVPALALTAMAGAWAQDYPNKPIRLIVPVAPAGMTDIMARIFGRKLQERLGQPVLVENKAGAGGNIGTEFVAKSAPDGYTLLYAYPGPVVVSPSIYKALSYDPMRDLAPVSMLVSYSMLIAVHPDVPAKNVTELVALAKRSPQPMTYGSAGNTTTSHLIMELFRREAGIQMLHIPYKGAAPAMTDLISGRLSAMADSLTLIMPQHQAGRIRAIAITSKERSPAAPDIPTVSESGFKDFEVIGWQGILTPAGTPRPVIERLAREFAAIVNEPDMRKEFASRGLEAAYRDANSFGQWMRAELATWRRLVTESNIKAD